MLPLIKEHINTAMSIEDDKLLCLLQLNKLLATQMAGMNIHISIGTHISDLLLTLHSTSYLLQYLLGMLQSCLEHVDDTSVWQVVECTKGSAISRPIGIWQLFSCFVSSSTPCASCQLHCVSVIKIYHWSCMYALTPLPQFSHIHICKEHCLVSAGKKSKLAQIMDSTCNPGTAAAAPRIFHHQLLSLSCAGRLAKLAGQGRVQPSWPL